MALGSSDWKNLPPGAAPAPAPVPEVRAFPAAPPAPGTSTETLAGCQLCGRGPAQWFTVRRHVGMLFLQKFYKANACLCRDHAEPLIKEYLSKTLAQGWWGIISFFVNISVVAQDLAELRKARKMAPPA